MEIKIKQLHQLYVKVSRLYPNLEFSSGVLHGVALLLDGNKTKTCLIKECSD